MDYELLMNGVVRIGQMAPNFEAITTMGNIKLEGYRGKWVVLFSHPGDFTPICSTEMIAFSRMNTYFEERNTCLIGLSVDSNPSHLAWIYDIYCKTGVIVPFPIIADRNGEIARKYGMISNNISNTETVRNVYIIDPNGIVRAILIYPMELGRCIQEILRMIDGLQTSDKCNCVIPANWDNGHFCINRPPKTFYELREREKELEENNNGMSWYLTYKTPCGENR